MQHVWLTFLAALLLQKNPIWQALLDDAEHRGAVVRNANAAELFPNMTELHLMQANRKAPAIEPQQQPPAQRSPAGTQGQTQDLRGVSQAARGAGAGRGGARGGRGWRQGGPGGLPAAPGQGHVNNNVAGPAQVQQLPDTQGNFAASVRQDCLTPAQQAIQQGKLQQQQQQQQQQRQQQRQQQQRQQQQQQQRQQQQQQQQQQQPLGQRGLADQSAGQQSGSSMQGVQHSHWDTSYSGGVPNQDPRQMPIGPSPGGVQAGMGQHPNRPPGPRPADPHPSFGLAHQNSSSQLAAVPGFGHHAGQHAPAAGDTFAGQMSDGKVMLQYPGAAPLREHDARPAMPAIPGASGQQATQ